MPTIKYPTVDELIELNKIVLKEIRVKKADTYKLLSGPALEKIIDKVKKEGEDIYEKAAILLMEITTKHPFASGVRRTAYAAAIAFLRTNGKKVNVTGDPQILQGIREGFYTRDEVTKWLRGHEIRAFKRT